MLFLTNTYDINNYKLNVVTMLFFISLKEYEIDIRKECVKMH